MVAVERPRKIDLSPRESELVRLASQGHTDSSIANELGISEATVSTYWGRVRMKVGPFSRPELIATILREQYAEMIAALEEKNRQLIEELRQASGKEWSDPEAEYYRNLVQLAPDAILIVREDGIIEVVNEECARLFGYRPEEIEGQILYTLVPERFREIHVRHREEYMRNPQKRKMAEHTGSSGLRKDGTEFPIAAALAPVETASGMRVMCIVREVPGREN
jgi:PAS domain S-box-containing protein